MSPAVVILPGFLFRLRQTLVHIVIYAAIKGHGVTQRKREPQSVSVLRLSIKSLWLSGAIEMRNVPNVQVSDTTSDE
jgi:hypothetical protein